MLDALYLALVKLSTVGAAVLGTCFVAHLTDSPSATVVAMGIFGAVAIFILNVSDAL